MKKMFIGLMTLAAGMFGAAQEAKAVQIYADAFVTPAGAQARACNYDYDFPVVCRVQVIGYYPNGAYLFAWNTMVLAPGTCNYAFVRSGMYPFSSADGKANCTAGYGY